MFSDFRREPESVGKAIKRHLAYYSLSLQRGFSKNKNISKEVERCHRRERENQYWS